MSVFNPSQLSSFNGVKSLLNSSRAVQQVLSYRNQPLSGESRLGIRNFCGRWAVVPVALMAAALILPKVLLIALAIPLICAKLGSRSKIYPGFPEIKHLISTRNRASAEARSLNELAPIEVKDPQLQKRLFGSKQMIKFQHHQGICRGEVDWFLKVYLETRGQFSDPKAHMMALGKLFEQGGPQESVLLQSLFVRGGKILDLKVGTPDRKWYKNFFNFDKRDFKSFSPSAKREFKLLPPGGYRVYFSTHATAFVKVSDELSYFFDPNVGIFEIKGESQTMPAFKLFTDVVEYLDKPEEDTFVPDINSNIVRFIPCQLRKS